MVANLKNLRIKHGYSQKAIAEMLGVTQQAIYKYENLSVEPDIETLIRLADIFGVSVDFLIGHETAVTVPISLTTEDIVHLERWKLLPKDFREEVDKMFKKYKITPADSETQIGDTCTMDKQPE